MGITVGGEAGILEKFGRSKGRVTVGLTTVYINLIVLANSGSICITFIDEEAVVIVTLIYITGINN